MVPTTHLHHVAHGAAQREPVAREPLASSSGWARTVSHRIDAAEHRLTEPVVVPLPPRPVVHTPDW